MTSSLQSWMTAVLATILVATPALAEKKYGPGASDTEIKIGQTMPYSGPASSYGTTGRVAAAYFDKLNGEGGINGRKIKFLTQDDAYQPPKTVEVVRRLIEQDEVLFVFGNIGTAANTAVHKYINARKVPHLLIGSGAAKFNDPVNFPWTMAYTPSYEAEGEVYATHILREKPEARIGILYQNDDSGKDLLRGLSRKLAAAGKKLILETTYETTDPTVDSQVIALKAAGADTLVFFGLPRFTAQMIRKRADIGWDPLTVLGNPGASVDSGLRPAGLDKAVGLVTAMFVKDPADSTWANDKGYTDWLAFMKRWYPDGSTADVNNVHGYIQALLVEQILRQCGDDLTRESVMRQAAGMKNVQSPMLLPGVLVNTDKTQYGLIRQFVLARFNGEKWALFGGAVGAGD